MKLKHVILAVSAFTLVGRSEPITPGTPLDVNLRIHQGIEILEFDSDASKYYQFEYSPDNVNWQTEGLAFKGNGGHISYAVSGRGADRAFYRLRDDADPKTVAIPPTDHAWINETPNRNAADTYTNTQPYDINLFIAVGVSTGNFVGEYGASRPNVLTRKDDSSSWLPVAVTATWTRPLQEEGGMNTVIPAGWQYKLDNDKATIYFWCELK